MHPRPVAAPRHRYASVDRESDVEDPTARDRQIERSETNVLTTFRFVAAVVVVCFHFGRDTTFGLLTDVISGPPMVTFFFVLSGFVLGIAYLDREPFSLRQYVGARVARIVPVYLLALAWCTALEGTTHPTGAAGLWLSLGMLQAWLPPYPESINPPGWSISVEVFLYACFPVALWLLRRYRPSVRRVALLCGLLWLITQLPLVLILNSSLYADYPSASHDLTHYFPPLHLCSFVLGLTGAYAWRVWGGESSPRWNLTALISAAWVLYMLTFENYALGLYLPFETSFLAPFFLVFILNLARCDHPLKRGLSASPLLLLGDASYAVYILQKPVYTTFEALFGGYLGEDAAFCAYLLALVLVSILCHRAFERPAQKAILTRWAGLQRRQTTR